MPQSINQKRLGWLVVGVVIGGLLTICLPAQPLHAVATHGEEGFILATGPVDNTVEGVYFLDSLTGELQGAVINVNNGQFTTFYRTNVLTDMKLGQVKNPKFRMVTGGAALRRGGPDQPGLSLIYVMEVNSGVMATYQVPWAQGRAGVYGTVAQYRAFGLLNVGPWRAAGLVRPQ